MKRMLASKKSDIQHRSRDNGFTLIELLVVVMIIGILAAIAIPVYIGVQANSKDAAVQSDLHTDKIAMARYILEQGKVPTQLEAYAIVSSPAMMQKYSFVQSSNTASFGYVTSGSGAATLWCLSAVGVTGNAFYVTGNRAVTKGVCPSNSSSW